MIGIEYGHMGVSASLKTSGCTHQRDRVYIDTHSTFYSILSPKQGRVLMKNVSYTMIYPFVQGDNSQALSAVQAEKPWYSCFIPPSSVNFVMHFCKRGNFFFFPDIFRLGDQVGRWCWVTFSAWVSC